MTKAAYKSRTKWPYSSMIGAVRAQWPGQLRAHIVEPANRQHWRWQKLLKQQSLTRSDKPPPTRPYFPILPKQFHLLGTKSSDIWASGRQSHPHCHNVSVWGSMCGYVHMNDGPCRGQRCRMPWSESFRQLWAFICRYWELNSGPLQEQYTFLTTKPSLQPAQVFLTYLCVFPGCGTEVMNTFGTSNSLSSNVGSTFHLV